MRSHSNWQWHLDEVFVKINGETHYLWHAAGHEGEVLESYVTKRRDRKAALKFLRKSMKRNVQSQIVVTDKLRSDGAALKLIGNVQKQETGCWLNNRAEYSHLPFRRRERSMLRFRQMRCLQKFASVHSFVLCHFHQKRHLYSRCNFKLNRSAALTKWHQLCSAKDQAFYGEVGRLVQICLAATLRMGICLFKCVYCSA
jgi:putative transposase